MSFAEECNVNPESAISRHECRAMRALSDDDDYSIATIAFMFECKDGTVIAHTNGECSHGGDADE